MECGESGVMGCEGVGVRVSVAVFNVILISFRLFVDFLIFFFPLVFFFLEFLCLFVVILF